MVALESGWRNNGPRVCSNAEAGGDTGTGLLDFVISDFIYLSFALAFSANIDYMNVVEGRGIEPLAVRFQSP